MFLHKKVYSPPPETTEAKETKVEAVLNAAAQALGRATWRKEQARNKTIHTGQLQTCCCVVVCRTRNQDIAVGHFTWFHSLQANRRACVSALLLLVTAQSTRSYWNWLTRPSSGDALHPNE